ncbi:MAG TPA: YkgJ family cysteine cluster protein [Candidatus Eremiobacteraeota bacterium]|nr:MAG: Flagellin N-methylase [bacterium ADurb.Bin363]HPZ06503.1 YkgJ family cysteine cluster protein [Candidatus Eremiobacteraeota bacterium]
MKKTGEKKKFTDYLLILNDEEIYWSVWGQLFYMDGQKESTLKILTSIEHSLCIYFHVFVEYFEIELEAAMDNYNDTLYERGRSKPTAYDLGRYECVRCGGCCWAWPCSITPDDSLRISKYLGISESVFLENYTVMINNDLRTLRRTEWTDVSGTRQDGYRLWDINTPCVFYDDSKGLCNIHSVKPEEGRVYKCWEEGKILNDKMQVLREKYNKKLRSLLAGGK